MKSFAAYLVLVASVHAQQMVENIRYAPDDELQALDVYAPPGAKDMPVLFWIHGGGWETGDKSEVHVKPQAFTEHGFVLVSPNYRLWPRVEMGTIFHDVAKAIGWVHRSISQYGGDPRRIVVMGHSAGAQLAALMCVDHRYVQAEGVPTEVLRACVPVDGDTYDVPAIIQTAELRQALHRLPQPTKGHRVKFGNDPAKHVEFSAVTHVADGAGIPPLMIMYVAGHPDVTAQAQRLAAALERARVPAKLLGVKDTNHNQLNIRLGEPDDAPTAEVLAFLAPLVAPAR